ncbi:hypothetical protein Tco_0084551 [Tanacetum coccineum]
MFHYCLYRQSWKCHPHLDEWPFFDSVDRSGVTPLALNKLDDLKVIVARHGISNLRHLLIIKARIHLNMMIDDDDVDTSRASTPLYLPPTLTSLVFSTTK